MTVYVRWYGKVLEGELLEGESMGMKQVRIPIDGHHAIVLFNPDRVYNSLEAASEYLYPTKPPGEIIKDMINFHREMDKKYSVSNFIKETINLQKIESFKAENWDQKRNHLCIDKLDDFYQLWRKVMVPSGFVEAEAPNILPTDNPVSLPSKLPNKISNKPGGQKPSKKIL